MADRFSGLIKTNGFYISDAENKITVNGLYKNTISNVNTRKEK